LQWSHIAVQIHYHRDTHHGENPEDYKNKGYLPEALLNFCVLLPQ